MLLGALAFVYSSFVKPAYNTVLNKRAQVKNRDGQIAELKTERGRVDQLAARYANAAELQSNLDVMLPNGENTASAIRQLGGLALANRIGIQSLGIQVTGLRPSSQSGLVKNIGTNRILFRAAGSYEDFKNFLRGIETNMAMMDVEGVKIEVPPGKNFSGSLQYTVSVLTHYEE